jgi:hypothetical protein
LKISIHEASSSISKSRLVNMRNYVNADNSI